MGNPSCHLWRLKVSSNLCLSTTNHAVRVASHCQLGSHLCLVFQCFFSKVLNTWHQQWFSCGAQRGPSENCAKPWALCIFMTCSLMHPLTAVETQKISLCVRVNRVIPIKLTGRIYIKFQRKINASWFQILFTLSHSDKARHNIGLTLHWISNRNRENTGR